MRKERKVEEKIKRSNKDNDNINNEDRKEVNKIKEYHAKIKTRNIQKNTK